MLHGPAASGAKRLLPQRVIRRHNAEHNTADGLDRQFPSARRKCQSRHPRPEDQRDGLGHKQSAVNEYVVEQSGPLRPLPRRSAGVPERGDHGLRGHRRRARLHIRPTDCPGDESVQLANRTSSSNRNRRIGRIDAARPSAHRSKAVGTRRPGSGAA